ncbi:MAG: hypothetical protein QW045_01830 [Candidatus Micrarchaeaceae archaeon]
MNRLLLALAGIYRQPKYIALTITAFAIYYFFIDFVIHANNTFVIMPQLMAYMLFLLELTSAILITISISASKRIFQKFSGSSIASVTAFIGSITIGCGCASPLLFAMTSFFLGAEAVVIDAKIANYQIYIIASMIAFNIILSIYYLKKVSSSACKV